MALYLSRFSSMAAVALAIAGGGALSSFETTLILTVEETMDALRKADQLQYRPPGGSSHQTPT